MARQTRSGVAGTSKCLIPSGERASTTAFITAGRCSPLTVTDQASRFVLACEALESDNGLPFASPNGLYNLSRLSVWWLRLGVRLERIKPGHPQQNGRHERMHLTLKTETTQPPGANSLQKQARFDALHERIQRRKAHRALDMRCPADLYTASQRPYTGLPEVDYPFHDRDVLVTACGRICMHRKKLHVSTVFAGQSLGIKEVDEAIWLVSFMLLRSGIYRSGAEDLANHRQPVRHEVVTHVLGTFCHPCLRVGQQKTWSGRWDSNPRPQPWQGCALPLSYAR
jgi:hypothetical protein